MSVRDYNGLASHQGHHIECAKYGDSNIALECTTCNEVLLDFDHDEVNEDNPTATPATGVRGYCPTCGAESNGSASRTIVPFCSQNCAAWFASIAYLTGFRARRRNKESAEPMDWLPEWFGSSHPLSPSHQVGGHEPWE